MKIAIFDYAITQNNPIGSCHLRILKGLCEEHQFTVFAADFENPDPSRIRWVKIPVIRRPIVALFITFHMAAPIFYWLYRLRSGVTFDLLQTVEGSSLLGDLSYSHFCHRTYLRTHWEKIRPTGLRGIVNHSLHWLQARLEPVAFRKAKRIVVPSRGLARELSVEYPSSSAKIQVLHNTVDTARMRAPEQFDRLAARADREIYPGDLVIVFAALGHFERKGLPQLLQALRMVGDRRWKLLVIGGSPQLVADYQRRVKSMHLEQQVTFLGMQLDVRPYLWISDLFALPSFYEVFPLVALEAAAAGLPLLVTPLNGVEEFLVDGRNGLLASETPESIAKCLQKFAAFSPEELIAMGEAARCSVSNYSPQAFVGQWRKLYSEYHR